jgi:hypothetical protein
MSFLTPQRFPNSHLRSPISALGFASPDAVREAIARHSDPFKGQTVVVQGPKSAVQSPGAGRPSRKFAYDGQRTKRPYRRKVELLPKVLALRAEEKTVKEIGHELGISPSHASKLLKEHSGGERLKRISRPCRMPRHRGQFQPGQGRKRNLESRKAGSPSRKTEH